MSSFVRSHAHLLKHLSGGRIWITEEGYPKYITKPRKWNEPGYRNYIFNTYTLYSVTRCIFWHYTLLIWKGAQILKVRRPEIQKERIYSNRINRVRCRVCKKIIQKEEYEYAMGSQSTSLNSSHEMICTFHKQSQENNSANCKL